MISGKKLYPTGSVKWGGSMKTWNTEIPMIFSKNTILP